MTQLIISWRISLYVLQNTYSIPPNSYMLFFRTFFFLVATLELIKEKVYSFPGTAVGLKDWLRITFAADPSSLEEAFRRIKSFYKRHAKHPQ